MRTPILAIAVLLSSIGVVAGKENPEQTTWRSVSHTVRPNWMIPERVTVSGEQAILQYFHFRNERFFQRILSYRGAEEIILIRTND